jgi:AcrR family transcriptional regulator
LIAKNITLLYKRTRSLAEHHPLTREAKMNSLAKTRKPRRISAHAQRTELLDAASEMLAKGGPEALSVRKLATAVGTSTMAIYTAFGGKEGLIAALYDEAFERMATTQESVPRPDNPLEWLAGLGAAYREFALKHPAYYALMISATLPLSELQPSEKEPVARGIASQRAYKSLDESVRACQQEGFIDPSMATEDLTAMFWATVHGHVSLELAGFHETVETAERLFVFLTRSIVSSVLSKKGQTAWRKIAPNGD